MTIDRAAAPLSAPFGEPATDEYAPFYAGYVAQASRHGPLTLLRRQDTFLWAACAGMTEDEALQRYSPEKWSVKQVVGHLSDAERVFAYRLLRISRGDSTPLSSFDENAYVSAAGSDERPTRALLDDFASVRHSTLQLIDGVAPEAWPRRGVASGVPISARALAFIIAGHVEHHLGILRDRYRLAIPTVEPPSA